MKDQVKQDYIISACHAEDTQKQNDESTSLLELGLVRHGVPYKAVRGCYLGTEEDSFLCVPRNSADGDTIQFRISLKTVTASVTGTCLTSKLAYWEMMVEGA